MTQAWFVTGTDTEIGKTLVSAALLHVAREHGFSAAGMKPIAAGTDAEGKNEDVEALITASSRSFPRQWVNRHLFAPAIAPHIAAEAAGVRIDLAALREDYLQLAAMAEVVVVEGAGGFLVPLGPDEDMADLAAILGLPVILVVGMRLGCINHALLTTEAIHRRGLVLAGWVANQVDPRMSNFAENLATLRQRIDAPLLGVIHYLKPASPQEAARSLQLPE